MKIRPPDPLSDFLALLVSIGLSLTITFLIMRIQDQIAIEIIMSLLLWPFIISLFHYLWFRNFSKENVTSQKMSVLKCISEIGDHPLKAYIWEQIGALYQDSKDIESESGVIMDEKSREILTKALFTSGDGAYVGVDSNLPSSYFILYPTYLDYNRMYLQKLSPEERKRSKRVLLAKDLGEIHDDYVMHPHEYRKMISWHEENEMPLFSTEKETALRLKEAFNIPSTDVGLWEESFAAFFTPTNDGKVIIKLARKGSALFTAAQQYINEITEIKNKEFTYLKPLTSKEIPIFPKHVAENWEYYVGPYEYRRDNLGRILLEELADFQNYRGRILDVAPGIGHELRLLLENGFDVAANEAEPILKETLLKKMMDLGHKIEIYSYDWRQLRDNLASYYSAVLALGNDLCMVRDREQRFKCIKQFYEILSPGGKLIIDERNFPSIVSKLRKGELYTAKDVMYMRDPIDFFLTLENGGKLLCFKFYHKKTKKILGALLVETLQPNELFSMLKKAGFKQIKIYGDLKLKYDIHQTKREDFEVEYEEDVGFYTYVAIK